MKRLSILLSCCALAFGQSTPIPPDDQKTPNQDFGLAVGTNGHDVGDLDILSDTQGVDFGPYLSRILPTIRHEWYRLIPSYAETQKGKLAIQFAITKGGNVADMRLVATSGDVALDRPAWGSISNSNPFPPLPSEFTGPFLVLRLRYSYNPDRSDSVPVPSKSSIGSVVPLTKATSCHGNSADPVGCTNPPFQTHAPPPKYPRKERKAHHEGVVTLKVVVNSEGVPTEITVAQTLSPDFDQAAIDAVKQWKFAPATRDGKAVAVQIAVEIAFHLPH